MNRGEPEDSTPAGSDLVDTGLVSFLRSEGLGPEDRTRLRNGVVDRIRAIRLRKIRIFTLSLVPAAAAGLLLGVFLVKILMPGPGRQDIGGRGVEEASDSGPGVDPAPTDTPPIPGPPTRRHPRETPAGADTRGTPRPGRPKTAAAPATIRGTVTDPLGNPVPDALVLGLRELQGDVARVDPLGHFHFRMAQPPRLHTFLLVSAPADRGLRDVLYRMEVGPGEAAAPLRLRMEAGLALDGRVVDGETRQPLEGAVVEMSVFWGGEEIFMESVATTRTGFRLKPPPTFLSPRTPLPRPAAFPHAPAPYQGEEMLAAAPQFLLQVMVQRRGFIPRILRFTNAADLARALSRPVLMHPGGRLRVQVVTPAGRPLQDAIVSLRPAAAFSGPFTYKALRGPRTDARGRVAFEGIPPGRVRVKAFHAGALPHAGLQVEIPRQGRATVEVSLTPGEVLGGRVTDPRGTPRAGAVLFAVPDRPAGKEAIQALGPVLAGADGHFLFSGLAPGPYSVHAYHVPGTGPEAVARIIPGLHTGTREVHIALATSSVDLFLTVKDSRDSKRIDPVTVLLLGPGGRAVRRPEPTGDGRWVLRGISPGRTAVQVLAPPYLPSTLHRIRPGRGPLLVEATLFRPSYVTGLVVDSAGSPLPGVIVAGGREETEPIRPDGRSFHCAGFLRSTPTDSEGRFTLTGLRVLQDQDLLPERGFSLAVLRPGHPPHTHDGLYLRQGEGRERIKIVVP